MTKKTLSTPTELLDVLYLQSKYPGRYSARGGLIGSSRRADPVADLSDVDDWEPLIPEKLRPVRERLGSNYKAIYTKRRSDAADADRLETRLSTQKINNTIMECLRGLALVGMAVRSVTKATRTHGERLWNKSSYDREITNRIDALAESMVMVDPEMEND